MSAQSTPSARFAWKTGASSPINRFMITPPELVSQSLTARPGPRPDWVTLADGRTIPVPAGWVCVPPGDPGLTRRVKESGPAWIVQESRGRKIFSRGVWAPADAVTACRATLELERADPAYGRKLARAAEKRAEVQAEYEEDFAGAVRAFLKFHPDHHELAEKLAAAVTAHAVPVGSGTVARTKRIPVEERAEAAVIAWLRHQTTAYDNLTIARIKGARRAVRRELAEASRRLLARYRVAGARVAGCPLATALGQ